VYCNLYVVVVGHFGERRPISRWDEEKKNKGNLRNNSERLIIA